MNNIFETAAAIGQLGPYLDGLVNARKKATYSRMQWELNMKNRSQPV